VSDTGLWFQHGATRGDELVAFLASISTPGQQPGLLASPVNAPATLRRIYQRARALGPVAFDPCGHLADRPHTKRSRDHFPWLAASPRPSTRDEWRDWIRSGLDHQLALGGSVGLPDFLVTPSPILAAAAGAPELYSFLDAVSDVQPEYQTLPLWLGITTDRAYLRVESSMIRLLDQLVDFSAPGILVRAFHDELAPVQDQAYLRGLKELVEACASNGTPIILANSGWLGWLALGWGATGFSAGLAAGTWVDREPSPMSRPAAPANYYFEAQLMRTVPWRVHEALARRSDYQACACAECVAMAGSYSSDLAAQHQLRQGNEESAALIGLSVPNRRARMLTRLTNAIAYRDGLTATLQTDVKARFLDRWRATL
jgi:hypothetical protein